MMNGKHDRIIQVPVTMGIPKRKADGSVKLEFITNLEISTDEYMTMDSYRQSQGWMLYRENEFVEEDIPEEDVDTDISKSQSTQLRDVLWVLYKAKGGDTAEKNKWETFYKNNMQMIKARVLDTVHQLEGK